MTDATVALETGKESYFRRNRGKLLVTAAVLAIGAYGLSQLAHVSVTEIFAILGRFSPWTVLAAFACVCLQIVCQGGRMWALFPSAARVRLVDVVRIFAHGQLINAFVPARAGDVVKVVALRQAYPDTVAASEATGVLLADKLLDALTLVPMMLIAGIEWRSQLPDPSAGRAALPWTVLALVAVAAAAWLFRRRLSGAFHVGRCVARSAASVLDWRRAFPALAFAAGSWGAELTMIHLLSHDLGHPLALGQCAWVLLVLNAGIAVPVSVANLGAFEASMALGLSRFGVPLPAGAAIGIVHHALQTGGLVVFGGLFALLRRRSAVVVAARGATVAIEAGASL